MGRERHAGMERQKDSTVRDRTKTGVQRTETPARGMAAPGPLQAALDPLRASPDVILALQRTIGNAAVNQLLRQHALSAAPVRRTPAPTPSGLAIQRHAEDEENVQTMPSSPGMSPVQRHAEGEDDVVQALPAAQRLHAADAPAKGEDLGARIRAAAGGSGGSALDGGVQRILEAGLGASLSGVRVHTGGEADSLSRSVQAVAFTTGSDIFFRSGAYNPSTSGGLHLLAHEAAHTVQQAQGPVAGTPHPGGVAISDPGDSFERAAEASAARVTAGAALQRVVTGPSDHLRSVRVRRARALPRARGEGIRAMPRSEQHYVAIQQLPIQRAKLKTSTMVTMLRGVAGLGELIDDNEKNPQGRTVAEHVTAVLNIYKARFDAFENSEGTSKAMMLAAVARIVGQQLGRRLNNPWVAPQIAQKIIAYYSTDIKQSLKLGETSGKKVVRLAGALASADPIMLYMTDKIDAASAAGKIVQMAGQARIPAGAMYKLLYQQYQMELGSYTRQQISAGTIGEGIVQSQAPVTGEKNLIGELSTAHFASVVNPRKSENKRTKWDSSTGHDELSFTQGAQAKLQALRNAVTAAAANPPVVGPVPQRPNAPGWNKLSDAQKRYIGGVEDAEAAHLQGQDTTIRGQIRSVLESHYHIFADEAERLIADFENKFSTIPLTTAFSAGGMFRVDQGNQLVYQSALKRELTATRMAALLPRRGDNKRARGGIETVGLPGPGGMAQHRNNPNYIRWRYEKDTKPAGYTDLGIQDLPEFAALSPSFAVAQGSETPADRHGVNQYGTSHVEYKPEVRDRCMYQFTAKGVLRRSPLLLLHDIAVDTPGALTSAQQNYNNARAAFTSAGSNDKPMRLIGLRAAEAELNTAKTKSVQATNVLHALMLNLKSRNFAFIDQQQIEVQIFGQLNFATDVQAMYVDPQESAQAQANAKAFCTRHGIRFATTARKEGSKLAAMNPAVNDAELVEDLRKAVQGRPEKQAARQEFDALAQRILTLSRMRGNEKTLYTKLYLDFTAAYNELGFFDKRQRRPVVEQVKQHIIVTG